MNWSDMQRRWVADARESDLGLWWLANDVRENLQGVNESDVRRKCIELLRPLLLTRDLRAVDLLEGGRFREWSGTIDDQVLRIEMEWQRAGVPRIGDIAWFIGPRQADHR